MINKTSPLIYRFAVIGLRRAGKSVFLAALGGEKRLQCSNATITYVDTAPPIAPGSSRSTSDEMKCRAKAQFLENIEGLTMSRVPPATETAEGITAHRFSLTMPVSPNEDADQVVEVELLDYAGELLKPNSDEAKITHLLRNEFGNTDALLILAETPWPSQTTCDGQSAAQARSQPLFHLDAAINKLSEENPEAITSAALLVTKWDRVIQFDGVRGPSETGQEYRERLKNEEKRHEAVFEKWLEDAPEAERIQQVAMKLSKTFDAAEFRVYPCSAFGQAKLVSNHPDGGVAEEVSAVSPLCSLNLIEPLEFLVSHARRHHRENILKLTAHTVDLTKLPSDEDLLKEHGTDSDLFNHVKKLRDECNAITTRLKWKKIKNVFAAGFVVFAILLLGTWRYRSQKVENTRQIIMAALAGTDINKVIAAQHKLDGFGPRNSRYYSVQDQMVDHEKLTAKECTLWGKSVQQPNWDNGLARLRQKTLPTCPALDSAIAKLNIQDWRSRVASAMAQFKKIADVQSCSASNFIVGDLEKALSDVKLTIERAPVHLDSAESVKNRNEVTKIYNICVETSTIAKRNKWFAENRNHYLVQQKWATFVDELRDFLNQVAKSDTIEWEARLEATKGELLLLKGKVKSWGQEPATDADANLKSARALQQSLDQLSGKFPKLATEIGRVTSVISSQRSNLVFRADCRAILPAIQIYKSMQGNLSKRSPEKLYELRAKINKYAARVTLKPLIKEMRNNLRSANNILVNNVHMSEIITGDTDPLNPEIWMNSLPTRTGETSPIKDKYTIDFPVNVTIVSDNRDNRIVVSLNDYRFNNNYYGGNLQFSNEELFSKMTTGLKPTAELYMKIFNYKETVTQQNIDKTTPNSSLPSKARIELSLRGRPLLNLQENKCPSD